MKKYLTTFIIAATFALGSLPANIEAAPLTSVELGLIASVLLQNGDFTQEQVIQVLGLLIAQSETPVFTVTNDNGKKLVLNQGELCGFTYAGGNSILAIQQELKNQGYAIEKIDGKIGPNTRAAVSAFQSAHNAAKVDGLIGQETVNLLIKNSLACVGDEGVNVEYVSPELKPTDKELVETNIDITIQAPCSFRYQGDESILAIQQELKNQGYAIEKIDGKIGPNTRAAVSAFQSAHNAAKVDGLIGAEVRTLLVRNSLSCTNDVVTVPDMTEIDTLENSDVMGPLLENDQTPIVTANQESILVPNVTVEEEPVINNFVVKDEVLSAVRTSGQTADDTAVFTYRMTLNPDTNIYISSNPQESFDINIYDQLGNIVAVEKVKSIVSSSQKILRKDGTTYFRVAKGDTLSLRATAQPGPGGYYAELGKLSYTLDNAQTIGKLKIIDYAINTDIWRSGTIQLKN